MSDLPDNQTSNYGWALWHLAEADKATVRGPDPAMYHLAAAQVRATLALTDQTSAGPDGYYEFHGSTWGGGAS